MANKKTLQEKRAELLEIVRSKVKDSTYHPVIEMALIGQARGKYAKVREDYALRFAAQKEVAQYIEPKLRAIESEVNAEMGSEFAELVKAVSGYKSGAK